MLLLKALGLAGDPTGVPVLREFLATLDERPLRTPLWGCPPAWGVSFRAAVELRAVQTSIELGDGSEACRLSAYVNSAELLVRRYARALSALAESLGSG